MAFDAATVPDVFDDAGVSYSLGYDVDPAAFRKSVIEAAMIT